MISDLMPPSIPELLAEVARRNPEAGALYAPGVSPSRYSEILGRRDQVVHQLNRLGAGRNDRVAVVLGNGPELAAAFLTISSAATFAPLNPEYTQSEFDFYLADLNARALVVRRGVETPAREAARRLRITVIDLVPVPGGEAGGFDLDGPEGPAPDSRGLAREDDVALVLHTSGTTARPKRVPLTHRNVTASAAHIRTTLALTPADRCLNVMPLFHIHGLIGATLASVAAGAGLVCTPGFLASSFFEWLEEFGATWYTAVPTIHQAVLAEAARRGAAAKGRRLRLIRSSSSALPSPVLRELESVFGVPVLESYGMTEAAHQICSNPPPPGKQKAGSVGPAAGPDVAVMGESDRLLGSGETGEIVIRGPNVTSGYEDNPEANAAAFAGGWLRTGDLGYRDNDGYFYLTGRIKELINRGSEKISPREIDEVLLDHPAVGQAVAFAVPHPTLGEDIAAAVVLRVNATVSPAELRELAFQRLAAFKVPSRIIIVDAIPKGPTGKIQRVGLAAKLAQELTTPLVAPQDEIDALLADIWQEVLGIEAVGMLDNFFAIGGDSLRGTRAIARVNELFDLDLAVSVAFRYPTLEQFSREIRRAALPERLESIAQILGELQATSGEEARFKVAQDRIG